MLYYLVRVEPFTTLNIQLQGGNFDHADRMFSDVAATWNGVLEDMSDVKELVWCLVIISMKFLFNLLYFFPFGLCFIGRCVYWLIEHLF